MAKNCFTLIGKTVRSFENELRIASLRQQGWKIGKGVVVDRGCTLECTKGEICDDVHIGRNCIIRGEDIHIGKNSILFSGVSITVKKRFYLGERSKIGRNVTIRAYSMETGRDLWCNENFEVGGGGWQKERAVLTVGDFVLLGKGASINVCEPVTVGSCTGIGIESMIFTHSSGNGQSILDGYTHVEKAVSIGSGVSVFSRAIIAPGTIVHDGVTVGAQSFLAGEAEENCLYAGVPAQKKKKMIPVAPERQLTLLADALEEELGSGACRLAPQNAKAGTVYLTNLFTEKTMIALSGIVEPVIICNQQQISMKEATVFCLGKRTLSGPTSAFSELVRDALRRNGILFSFNGYQPFPLSYEVLVKLGIERE